MHLPISLSLEEYPNAIDEAITVADSLGQLQENVQSEETLSETNTRILNTAVEHFSQMTGVKLSHVPVNATGSIATESLGDNIKLILKTIVETIKQWIKKVVEQFSKLVSHFTDEKKKITNLKEKYKETYENKSDAKVIIEYGEKYQMALPTEKLHEKKVSLIDIMHHMQTSNIFSSDGIFIKQLNEFEKLLSDLIKSVAFISDIDQSKLRIQLQTIVKKFTDEANIDYGGYVLTGNSVVVADGIKMRPLFDQQVQPQTEEIEIELNQVSYYANQLEDLASDKSFFVEKYETFSKDILNKLQSTIEGLANKQSIGNDDKHKVQHVRMLMQIFQDAFYYFDVVVFYFNRVINSSIILLKDCSEAKAKSIKA